MNSKKIEMGAILSLKQIILEHDLMDEYINDNDKEPSWDGSIYLHKSEDLKVENISCRVPVQVKGKNNEDLLKCQVIPYSVEYKYLRNYYYDGGVFFVVVVISDDRKKKALFYNTLTTIKLKDLLKGKENKKADQEKTIYLRRLEKDYGDNLYKLLKQFGMDRKDQGLGDGELVKKSINIEDMSKIDSIKASSYWVSNEAELLKEISEGEITLYGHRTDIDMWLPFDYSHQKEIEIKSMVRMDKSIGISDENYYDYYIVERDKTRESNPIVRLSENLSLDLIGGKINLDIVGDIETLVNDANFINALKEKRNISINGKEIIGINSIKFSRNMKANINLALELAEAFKEMGIQCNKKIKNFTQENWESISNLLYLYRRKIRPKEGQQNAWYVWKWDDVVVPLLLVINEYGKVDIINWFTTKRYSLFVSDELRVALPNFVIFKRDILEKLYNVPKSIWIEEIERVTYSEHNTGVIFSFFVEILSAYDEVHNETYYDVAELLINKVLEVNPNSEYGIINQMQLIKRKNELSGEQIAKLEEMEKKTNDSMVKCAINILLENKRVARKILEEMNVDKQNELMSYPIYNLL